jgi:hypothetical protein
LHPTEYNILVQRCKNENRLGITYHVEPNFASGKLYTFIDPGVGAGTRLIGGAMVVVVGGAVIVAGGGTIIGLVGRAVAIAAQIIVRRSPS